MWAATFDGNEEDFFKIQREIAENVAKGLSVTLSNNYKSQIRKRLTENLGAYKLYLEGRLLWNSRKKLEMYQAIEKYELAVARDPEFALGYIGIAECYNMIAAYGFSPPGIAYPKAKAALDKALLINRNISKLHSSLGWYYWNFEYDFDSAEKALLEAVKLNLVAQRQIDGMQRFDQLDLNLNPLVRLNWQLNWSLLQLYQGLFNLGC